MLTASYDKTAKIWDTESGKELYTLKRHAEHIISAAFSPDGRRVLTKEEEDNTAKIWDTVDWTLTREEFPEYQRQRYEKWVKANVPNPE